MAFSQSPIHPAMPSDIMRILVIDDEALMRKTLARALEAFGVYVTQAESSAEALGIIEAAGVPFDMIFCDLSMPGRDGLQTLRDFADRRVTSGIGLSSGQSREIVAAAESTASHHGLHVLGHLNKPFDRAKIAALLAIASKPRAVRHMTSITAPLTGNDIHRGIAAGEFDVVFQPKVNPTTGAVEGVESLARWHHGTHGTIPPNEFIALAEATDTIDALTDVILARALDGARRLRENLLAVPVSVNLSTRSMDCLELPDRLYAAVLAGGCEPAMIMIEVTESCFVENLTNFLEVATRLRLKGFSLSIDDFGTGFSTLEQVRRLPLSELKIDRAFVAGAPENTRTRHILETTLNLGRNLGMTCVCEGVETAAEWELVRRLGTHTVQGYYVARPMNIDSLIPWAKNWALQWPQSPFNPG